MTREAKEEKQRWAATEGRPYGDCSVAAAGVAAGAGSAVVLTGSGAATLGGFGVRGSMRGEDGEDFG
jgi:hypothetical protein